MQDRLSKALSLVNSCPFVQESANGCWAAEMGELSAVELFEVTHPQTDSDKAITSKLFVMLAPHIFALTVSLVFRGLLSQCIILLYSSRLRQALIKDQNSRLSAIALAV